MNDDLIGYCLEPHCFEHLRKVSKRLNDPAALSWDDRRDLANLIDLIRSQAIPLTTKDMK